MKKIIKTDVVLIGAGIMSATLATLLKELQPDLDIHIIERLDAPALESSDAWNNAGTGHSALCELNYTPELEDGTVDTRKAIQIYQQFELSKQFWTYLCTRGGIRDAKAFIHTVPHVSFVKGEKDVAFLRKRYQALVTHPYFRGLLYSEQHAALEEWMPLVMKGRAPGEPVAATYAGWGTDVNFGALTRAMFRRLEAMDHVRVRTAHEVEDLKRRDRQEWQVKVKNVTTGETKYYEAPFVFIGAGGASLLLLEQSGIPEGKYYGGFPVGGQWLKCTNPQVIRQHHAKVYGKASVGAPPMSVPHLDTRYVDEGKALLFGPYAGFSSKFLKHGSPADLWHSLSFDNILPMLQAGWDNMDLTRYLIGQVTQSRGKRVEALLEYYPEAKAGDWTLEIAGQRVQVIKKDKETGGVLEFGTEIVHAADGSLAALLGASPGASTAAAIMLEVLQKCFAQQYTDNGWKEKLEEIFPSTGLTLPDDEDKFLAIQERCHQVLQLSQRQV
ncbi:MAG: malate dehydrogenase (quinone) [Taibaiella sp.]|nr:malate dehydrogenase (quinone) [Taibaiella sp.]